ncbi:hypothetical protein [Aeromicrobium wangtongii]|uniref:hypothetical protein n=1 Tax=Aeromicrobium wangtongii TaxID=2969247 RepID=UPI0020171A59|nr:hypothetical protein [Aeromicrobium wangtongii]MCL3819060.1 hypothetical protein [Aeromicrobium wangtongii]
MSLTAGALGGLADPASSSPRLVTLTGHWPMRWRLPGRDARKTNYARPLHREEPCPTLTSPHGRQISFTRRAEARPVVMSHGWLLASDSWEIQQLFVAEHGIRASSVADRSQTCRDTARPLTDDIAESHLMVPPTRTGKTPCASPPPLS